MSLAQLYPDLPRWLAVPYRKPARDVSADTLDGWDCWGCIRFIGRARFGRDHDSFAGAVHEAIDRHGAGADALPNEAVAAIIRAGLPCYRAVPAAPGAVALFRVGAEFLHVAQMLTPTLAIHALQPTAASAGGTGLIDLTRDRWGKPHRLVGFFDLAG